MLRVGHFLSKYYLVFLRTRFGNNFLRLHNSGDSFFIDLLNSLLLLLLINVLYKAIKCVVKFVIHVDVFNWLHCPLALDVQDSHQVVLIDVFLVKGW